MKTVSEEGFPKISWIKFLGISEGMPGFFFWGNASNFTEEIYSKYSKGIHKEFFDLILKETMKEFLRRLCHRVSLKFLNKLVEKFVKKQVKKIFKHIPGRNPLKKYYCFLF